MKTYMYIQVAYPIIMKRNRRKGLRRGGRGGDGGIFFRFLSTNEKLALFKRMLNAKVIRHYKIK